MKNVVELCRAYYKNVETTLYKVRSLSPALPDGFAVESWTNCINADDEYLIESKDFTDFNSALMHFQLTLVTNVIKEVNDD